MLQSFREWLNEQELNEGKLKQSVEPFMEKFLEFQKIYPREKIENPKAFEKVINKLYDDWSKLSYKSNFCNYAGDFIDTVMLVGFRITKESYTNFKENLGINNVSDNLLATFYKDFMQEYEKKYHVNLHTNDRKG